MDKADLGPCPQCGGNVSTLGACHTYGDEHGWYACVGCYSALMIFCIGTEGKSPCDWDYTWGLNPRNPRAAKNEESRPGWLVGDFPY